eukprot:jgi/Botrbrau1/960/Bobra.114_1s0004.1
MPRGVHKLTLLWLPVAAFIAQGTVQAATNIYAGLSASVGTNSDPKNTWQTLADSTGGGLGDSRDLLTSMEKVVLNYVRPDSHLVDNQSGQGPEAGIESQPELAIPSQVSPSSQPLVQVSRSAVYNGLPMVSTFETLVPGTQSMGSAMPGVPGTQPESTQAGVSTTQTVVSVSITQSAVPGPQSLPMGTQSLGTGTAGTATEHMAAGPANAHSTASDKPAASPAVHTLFPRNRIATHNAPSLTQNLEPGSQTELPGAQSLAPSPLGAVPQTVVTISQSTIPTSNPQASTPQVGPSTTQVTVVTSQPQIPGSGTVIQNIQLVVPSAVPGARSPTPDMQPGAPGNQSWGSGSQSWGSGNQSWGSGDQWWGSGNQSWGIGTQAKPPSADPKFNWVNWGNGPTNTRFASSETKISPQNVASVVVKNGWPVQLFGDISATPTVVDGVVYIVDWGFPNYLVQVERVGPFFTGNGHISAIDANTGKIIWTREVQSYTGTPGYSRTSPAVEGDFVVIGTNHGGIVKYAKIPDSTYVLALSKNNGNLIWKTLVDPHPLAGIVTSPTIANGGVYIGVSSTEESLQDGTCCSFVGTAQKLDLYTGKVLWSFKTVPAGYYGGAIWASSPPVDTRRNLVYFATGNNYIVPPDVDKCQEKNIGNYTAQALCESPDNWINSVVALDATTGQLKWGRKLGAADVWVAACSPVAFIFPYSNCTGFSAVKDWDFGQMPMLIYGKNGQRDLLAIGQKSGMAWGLNPDTGAILWGTDTKGTSKYGGIMFGSATDGERIYMSNANTGSENFPMINTYPGQMQTSLGSYAIGLDLNGNILWETANPWPVLVSPIRLFAGLSPTWAVNLGPVSVANGVVYWPSMDYQGRLIFLDAKNGRILGNFETGRPIGSLACGPSIVDGTIYVGSGYSQQLLPSLLWHAWALTLPSLNTG